MGILRFLLGLAVAVFIQTAALRILPDGWWIIDPFLLLLVIWSLSSSPMLSLGVGTSTGLVQDAWTGGFYGLHGFADTSTAWLVAYLRQRFVIQQSLQFGLLFALAAVVQQTQLALLNYLVLSGAEGDAQILGPGRLVATAIANGVLGPILLAAADRTLGGYRDWNRQRRQRLGIDLG